MCVIKCNLTANRQQWVQEWVTDSVNVTNSKSMYIHILQYIATDNKYYYMQITNWSIGLAALLKSI